MPLPLPFEHSVATVRGAAVDTAIPVGGLAAGNQLLAVIEHDAGSGAVAGRDPAAFAVSAGEIESASLDTSGSALTLVWTKHG